MAKAAVAKAAEKKSAKADPVKQVAVASYLERHGGERVETPPAIDLVRKALRAWELSREIAVLDEELSALEKDLAVIEGMSLVVPGVCRVSVARTSSVSIADAEKLRQLLGDRWADLVVETVSYKPTDRLVEIASDADDPMAPAYRELLKVRTGVAVRLLAEK